MKIENATMAELKAKAAEYRLKSENLLAERNTMAGGTSNLMFTRSNSAKMWAARASDYESIIALIEGAPPHDCGNEPESS